MDFSLSSDQLLIRNTVRQFMETEMRPILRDYERDEKFPADEIRKLGELGCCAMLIPEDAPGTPTRNSKVGASVCSSNPTAALTTPSVLAA